MAAGLLVLVAASLGIFRWISSREVVAPSPSLQWQEPEAVAAWARVFLSREGAQPDSVSAQAVDDRGSPRRILVSVHPGSQEAPRILRATARMLVAARAEGAESAAHLAVIRQGDQVTFLPIGEAADLATSDILLAQHLGLTLEELGFAEESALDDAGGVAPSSGAEPGTDGGIETEAGAESGAGSAGAGETTTTQESEASGNGQAQPAETGADTTKRRRDPSEPPPVIRAVSAGPPARVARANGPVPLEPSAGTTSPVFRLQVAAGARRRLTLRSLTLSASGTLPDVDDIAFVDLLRETDVSGRGATRPEKLGERQSFGDDDGSITFGGLQVPFGEDGLPLALLVQAEFLHAVEGGTFRLSLGSEAGVELEDSEGATVRVTGLPVMGPTLEIEGNMPPDFEQERLDRLAEEGPDASDPNAERLQREAAERAQSEAKAASIESSAEPEGTVQADSETGAGDEPQAP